MRKNKRRQIGVWILVFLLALMLAALFRWENKRQKNTEQILQKEAELTQTDSASVEEKEPEQTQDEVPEEPEQKTISLSFRGDSFNADGADKGTGYPAKIKSLLEQNSITANVDDQTWDMAGTLSQMRLAGVSEETVNAYIAKHQAAATAAGVQPAPTETRVRSDLGDYAVDRSDMDMIPVICIGFNGGFGGDLAELIEQQQQILNTYHNQDHYLILGCYPNGWTDGAAYDQAMSDYWGEHYLSLNGVINAVDLSDTLRGQIADAVYSKLVELKYI